MADQGSGVIHVEYVTDRDTEVAWFAWCAHRRRALVPSAVFLFAAALLVLVDVRVLWRDDRHTLAFLFAMALQIVAIAVAAIARDPARPQPFAYPHAELVTLGLLAASFVVTFEHQSSLLALLLMVVVLTLFVVLAVSYWRGFAFLRERVPDFGSAVHVRVDDDGLEFTVRPRPTPRRVRWKSVRYVGSDEQSLFVVTGVEPIIVPRRAFASSAAWDGFVGTVGERVEAALRSSARGPIGRHVRRAKAGRA